MIDTHCHLTYPGLIERVEAVLEDAAAAGVDRMITIGTSPADAQLGISLAEQFGNVYATAGVHPGHSDEVHDIEAMKRELREQIEHPRVVALGEMGLDWHYSDPPRDTQMQVFAAQLELMSEAPNLRGVIHNRKATADTLALLSEQGVAGPRLVFHCFTGTPEEVELILATGAMVSFTGIVTFASAAAVAEASDLVPLDRLMIETDSPYLTPAPFRKIKTNEPKYVAQVAKFLAERRGMTPQAFTEAVDHNAQRFFDLPITSVH